MSAAKEKTTLRPPLDELVLDVKRRRDHWERARPSGREHPHPKVQKQQKMGENVKSSEFASEKRYKIRDHPGGRLGRGDNSKTRAEPFLLMTMTWRSIKFILRGARASPSGVYEGQSLPSACSLPSPRAVLGLHHDY